MDDIKDICNKNSVPFEEIGKTSGGELVINNIVKCSVLELKDIYESAIPRLMERISH